MGASGSPIQIWVVKQPDTLRGPVGLPRSAYLSLGRANAPDDPRLRRDPGRERDGGPVATLILSLPLK